jgi:hypothetical protein
MTGNGGRTVDHRGQVRARRLPVGSQHDIGVEDGDERVEVAVATARRGLRVSAFMRSRSFQFPVCDLRFPGSGNAGETPSQ